MSRLRIKHTTGYRYEREASASYNEARMLPVSSNRQFVIQAKLSIHPSANSNQYDDYWGTRVTSFDVLTPHTELQLTAESLVEVHDRGFPGHDTSWGNLEAASEQSTRSIEFLRMTPRTEPNEELVQIAKQIKSQSATPGEAAMAIARRVGEEIEYTSGSTLVSTLGREAWEARKGVCQDIAHITLGALRAVGIPARYASGYLHPRPNAEIGEAVTGESHAWVEWYTGGWNGWDPTNLCDIGPRHVNIGYGRDYNDVPPLRGIFAGGGASNLFVQVEVTKES